MVQKEDQPLSIALGDEFDRAKARYNRACYKAMLNYSQEEVINDLEAAIAVEPHPKMLI